jgi:SET domain-containing protein
MWLFFQLITQDKAELLSMTYQFALNKEYVVDAARRGNESRFINHSRRDPNCFAKIMKVNGDHRIGIYAERDIAEGEELFLNYKFDGEFDEKGEVVNLQS